MKNLLLIGDSIRMGYDKSVKKTLEGKANVIFPDENCRFASYVLRYFHEYLKDETLLKIIRRSKILSSFILDDSFAVHDIRIIEGDNGLFIAMPSRKTATGGYRDIAHPINSETRDMIQKTILDHYEKALEDGTLESAE